MSSLKPQMKAVESTSIGIFVMIGFLFFLIVLLFGFSAYITRTSTDAQTAGGVSLDKLIHSIEEMNKVDEELRSSSETLAQLIQAKTVIESEIESAKRSLNVLSTSTGDIIGGQLADLLLVVTQDPESSLKKTMLDAMAVDREEITEGPLSFAQTRRFVTNVQTHPFGSEEQKQRADLLVAEVSKTLTVYTDKFSTVRYEISQNNVQKFKHDLQINSENTRQVELKNRRATVVADIPEDGRARFSSLNLFDGTLLTFIKMPTIILTLLVTIAAGGLASLVSFTRKFLRTEKNNVGVSRLLTNVAEGIAASIGIFLFAGTGMLMLTQGSGGDVGNRVELSPYMVAFIAFLSGFMAESAFAKIEDSGRKLFNTDDAEVDEADEEEPVQGTKPDKQPRPKVPEKDTPSAEGKTGKREAKPTINAGALPAS
ncbi:hypothetical protein [Roseibium polysiphoniae]|uniref:MotA/TolQ/ExbB proton channel domain-containing protein n=1 Tax=Roseibium polysiphoniae TaxID=2571221 RepID=A0ABR9C517_9HYPH|nr:hypothetical protein [Roseibium polysiphoniae]MBD8874946.1 hypothetical protein [Roseibium polysiphoniae]